MQQDPTITQPDPAGTNDMPTPESMKLPSKNNHEGWKSILSTVAIIIAAPLVALVLINFVFQSYEVDGESMETTLQNQDRLIVWKVPKTIADIKHKSYIPGRGDIIVFTKHGLYENGKGGDKQLIKRVIGLPGDRVVVKDGNITIYNQENPQGFNPDEAANHGANANFTIGNTDVTVGEDEVFVSGDNRSNSLDSRSFGPIPTKDIIGKLELRVFPFNKFDSY